jgi:hypothetical protein
VFSECDWFDPINGTRLQTTCLSPYISHPNTPDDPRPHALMDHRYNPLPFSIQNSNSYSCMSQTFILQGSHSGPTPVMRWGRSPTAGQTSMWLPLPPPSGYCPPPPPIGHPGQSSSTPPPHSSPGYWSPL